ncbi:MAG: SDR family NAD(P)-dependent oxidoreductase [Bacteroidales bacterium]
MEDSNSCISNKSALVTGASSGIGVHYAAELARRGYNVILVSNKENEVKYIAANIALEIGAEDISDLVQTKIEDDESIKFIGEAMPNNKQWIMGIYKNLAMPNSAEKLFEFYPNIEVIVNNAGIFFFNDIVDCNMGRIETIINLHILTVTKLCRLYGERMRNNKKGYILNMASISVHTPFPGISLYTATKSYIRTFTRAFYYEMKEYGVKVTVVSPGAVATDLYRLPKNLQELGVNLGIIYRPQKLAKRALDKLFIGKKEFIPGCINRLFKPIFSLICGYEIMFVRKKTKYLMK